MSQLRPTAFLLLLRVIVGCQSEVTPIVDASVADAPLVDNGVDAVGEGPDLVDRLDAASAIDTIDATQSDVGESADHLAATDVSDGDVTIGSDAADVPPDVPDAVGNCMSADGGVWRSCSHCALVGQLFVFACARSDSGPCYAYPNTCVDPGFVDCQYSSDTSTYPRLRERCAQLCARLRAEESVVPCSY